MGKLPGTCQRWQGRTYKARLGAALLVTFLVLASYYFHPFWKLEGQTQQEQMIQFMKNLSMMGAMLFLVA